MPVTIAPYQLSASDELLADLKQRLQRTRWPQSFPEQGWDYGTNTEYMKSLVDYWINDFDWRKQEAEINQYPHYKADVDGLGVHFMHIPGRGPNPTPLCMLHGYPWSCLLYTSPSPRDS